MTVPAAQIVFVALCAAMIGWLVTVLFVYAVYVGAVPALLLTARGADALLARRRARRLT